MRNFSIWLALLIFLSASSAVLSRSYAAQRASQALGSDHQPLVIKVVPSPASTEELKHDERHMMERSQDLADRDSERNEQERNGEITEGIGGATVVILIVQAIAFFLQSRELHRSVTELRAATSVAESASVSAKAAADAAIEANNLNRQALNAEQRPWVTLEIQINKNSGVSHDLRGWHFPLEYTLKNLGKTPARRARFFARVIAYTDNRTGSDGTLISRTDVAAELRDFAQRARAQAESSELVGSLIFPGETTRQLSFNIAQGDPIFEGSLRDPAYAGLLVVLCCATYFSTIDGSPHETAQAFSLGLWDGVLKQSSRIELVNNEFKMNDRNLIFAPNPWGDDYAT